MSELENAVNDWAERISVEACARVRANYDNKIVGSISQEHWDLFSAAAVTGASLALLSVVKVNPLDESVLRRLVEQTP